MGRTPGSAGNFHGANPELFAYAIFHQVAVKPCHLPINDLARTWKDSRTWKDELRRLTTLRNPCITTVLGVVVDTDEPRFGKYRETSFVKTYSPLFSSRVC